MKDILNYPDARTVPGASCTHAQKVRGAERSHSQFYAKRDSPSAVDPAAVSRSFGQPARRTQLASDGCCPAAMVVDRLVPGPPPQKWQIGRLHEQADIWT